VRGMFGRLQTALALGRVGLLRPAVFLTAWAGQTKLSLTKNSK